MQLSTFMTRNVFLWNINKNKIKFLAAMYLLLYKRLYAAKFLYDG